MCAAQSSSTCSTQPDRKSLKLQLHCGYQFPRCALTLTHQDLSALYMTSYLYHTLSVLSAVLLRCKKKSCPLLKLKYVYFNFKIGEISIGTVVKKNYGYIYVTTC